ncbi:MAG: FtsX-like permease family protein [Rhodospirillales bacterium]
MFSRRSDIPLDRDALSRFLPWLIAFMVYMASLALAGVLVLHAAAGRWDKGMSTTMTVQIPPPAEAGGAAANQQKQVEKALSILRSTPGVVHAEAIEESRILALLEPWLGTLAGEGDLPLPRLIDVELVTGADIDVKALSLRLAAAAPGAAVDDHRLWLDRMIRLIRSVETLAVAVLALIVMTTAGTVVFTTRTGLAIHQEAIEVLHLIGAQDTYVARQFAGRALALGLRGGVIGLGLAVPTLLAIGSLAESLEGGLLPDFSLSMGNWAVLAALPLVVAMIAMFTARRTVLRNLSRML